MIVDRVIDKFVDVYGEQAALVLLKVIAHPSQGGLGYRVVFFNPTIDLDGYQVEHATRTIRLDTAGLLSSYSAAEVAASLKAALDVEISKTHAGLLERVGWGTGKVLLGVIEAGTGLVGIVVPEPGTTAAGVVVFALGANTIADGFSQLAGANSGHGYNVLGEASGTLGAGAAQLVGVDPKVGKNIGKGMFLVTSIAVGSVGSIRILSRHSRNPTGAVRRRAISYQRSAVSQSN